MYSGSAHETFCSRRSRGRRRRGFSKVPSIIKGTVLFEWKSSYRIAEGKSIWYENDAIQLFINPITLSLYGI